MRIELDNVGYTYGPRTPFAHEALRRLTLALDGNESVGLVGPIGSGKTTLIRLVAGLANPTTGRLLVYDDEGKASRRSLFGEIGVVFQQPEDMFVAPTVFEEVAYGAINIGLRGPDLAERIDWALQAVGLDINGIGHRSPFQIGGGEKRRVAIASVLAMKPSLLMLDEPAANLDARGRRTVLECISRLHSVQGMGVLFASHHLGDILPLVKRLVVLHGGVVVFDGLPSEVLLHVERLENVGLQIPPLSRLMIRLRHAGLAVPIQVYDVEQAIQAIRGALTEGLENASRC